MDAKRAGKILIMVLGFVSCAAVYPLNGSDTAYGILTNFPNPFDSRHESTTIRYTLMAESEVEAKIYDLFGNLVKEFPSKTETAGTNTVAWDGTDQNGSKVSKGGYILEMEIKSGGSKVLATRKIGVLH